MNLSFIILFTCTTGTIFCADPHTEMRMELETSMSPHIVATLIQEDERARNALSPTNALTYIPSAQSTPQPSDSKIMTPEERKAFQEKMALRARNAKFGNLGK